MYLTINKDRKMKRKWHHCILGFVMGRLLKNTGVTVRDMLKEIHMSSDTYEQLKKATIRS